MKNLLLRPMMAPLGCACLVALIAAGCGGASGGSAGGGAPTATATPIPTSPPMATATPGPSPTMAPLPSVPFTVRGRISVGGVASPGVVVTASDLTSGAVLDRTTSGAGGGYSFFLAEGSYSIRATAGTRTGARTVTVPPGGQTVDNFNLNL